MTGREAAVNELLLRSHDGLDEKDRSGLSALAHARKASSKELIDILTRPEPRSRPVRSGWEGSPVVRALVNNLRTEET